MKVSNYISNFLYSFNFNFVIDFLINFPEKKFGKMKRNKENILVLYHTLHIFYQSLNFIIETFKIEGLILRIYRSSHWRCSGRKGVLRNSFLPNFLKIALKLPCESVVKIPKEYVWRIPRVLITYSRTPIFPNTSY